MLDYPPGWTCEQTTLKFKHYLLGSLLLTESLAVAEHLEACDGCSQRLVVFRLTLAEHVRG